VNSTIVFRRDCPCARPRISQAIEGDRVAHALLRAAPALLPTPCFDAVSLLQTRVEKSLDTARRSACATSASRL
jgi:hypothetical protein